MNIHAREKTSGSWQSVKGQLITLFGGITPVANKLGVHPNSIRMAVAGRCPGVLKNLKALIARETAARSKRAA